MLFSAYDGRFYLQISELKKNSCFFLSRKGANDEASVSNEANHSKSSVLKRVALNTSVTNLL